MSKKNRHQRRRAEAEQRKADQSKLTADFASHPEAWRAYEQGHFDVRKRRIEEKAAGVIDFDRLNKGESASFHGVFDNDKINRAVGAADSDWVKQEVVAGDRTWEIEKESHPDPRAVAVQFYLSLLASCVTGGLNLRAVANRIGKPYPDCISHDSILHAAAHQYDEKWKGRDGPLTPKDYMALHNMLATYVGRVFFDMLKAARIFQMRVSDFRALYHIVDVYVTSAAGFKWTPAFDDAKRYKPVPDDEAAATAKFTMDEGIKVPFPEKLPFESCYLAWGSGVVPSLVQAYQYGLDPKCLNLVMGTLIDDLGWAFTITLKGKQDTVGFAIGKDQQLIGGMETVITLERVGKHRFKKHVHADGSTAHGGEEASILDAGWTLPFALTPWIILYAIDAIDRNDSLTTASAGLLSEKMKYKSLSKKTRQHFVPAPYYTVLIQPTTYREMETRAKSRKHKPVDYRFDVRGHYAHRIIRGTLPLTAKLINQLHKRKYEIFHALHHPHGEALALLLRKRVAPPREGEWLAYLKWRRDNFIKGPKDKPYIQSVHKLKRKLPEIV